MHPTVPIPVSLLLLIAATHVAANKVHGYGYINPGPAHRDGGGSDLTSRIRDHAAEGAHRGTADAHNQLDLSGIHQSATTGGRDDAASSPSGRRLPLSGVPSENTLQIPNSDEKSGIVQHATTHDAELGSPAHGHDSHGSPGDGSDASTSGSPRLEDHGPAGSHKSAFAAGHHDGYATYGVPPTQLAAAPAVAPVPTPAAAPTSGALPLARQPQLPSTAAAEPCDEATEKGARKLAGTQTAAPLTSIPESGAQEALPTIPVVRAAAAAQPTSSALARAVAPLATPHAYDAYGAPSPRRHEARPIAVAQPTTAVMAGMITPTPTPTVPESPSADADERVHHVAPAGPSSSALAEAVRPAAPRRDAYGAPGTVECEEEDEYGEPDGRAARGAQEAYGTPTVDLPLRVEPTHRALAVLSTPSAVPEGYGVAGRSAGSGDDDDAECEEIDGARHGEYGTPHIAARMWPTPTAGPASARVAGAPAADAALTPWATPNGAVPTPWTTPGLGARSAAPAAVSSEVSMGPQATAALPSEPTALPGDGDAFGGPPDPFAADELVANEEMASISVSAATAITPAASPAWTVVMGAFIGALVLLL
ncbi:hypothetical protein CXG81DRAFT_18261 [Caulochytrium protostelioides]|uniref:Uncharacterized protein n=1 Tax=Caulochytrium protostelioides TaxID=1555241 RepID=A0A4P9X9P6_9FUNG|nr:hypothetical protein CXG81DRAFT_18261 [Caulochytrium protostelioides]|eukprot:RKP02026.1 hypothetical protein CXG81DRAFT_18261 [Caulochytrium protostelioides]